MEKVLSFLKTFLRTLKKRFKIEFTSMTTVVFLYTVIRIILEGMEQYLILPTAWYYIDSFGQTKFFLGVIFAVYSVSVMIFSPCLGALDDRFHATKTILLFCAVLKFLGSLLYSIPVSEYFPLFGRLISGIAGGSLGVLYGVVLKDTDKKSRTKAFLFFEGLFCVGKALAPSIGSFLTFNADILGWKINAGNSPGFILAISWFFMIFLSLCLPRNLGCEETLRWEEDQLDLENDNGNKPESKPEPDHSPKLVDSKIAFLYFILLMVFMLSGLISFDTPLLAADLLNLQLIHVKVLFLNGTLVVFIVYLSNYFVSEYVSERNFVAITVALQIFPLCLLFYFALTWNNANQVLGPYFLLLLICLGLILGFSFPIISSLLSKMTNINHAAFYQGLANTVLHLGVSSSRLVAGLFFNKSSLAFTCTGFTFFWIVQVVWLFVVYKELGVIRV